MTATVTVRSLIADVQGEVGTTDLHPTRASELLLKATALLGSCLAEIREADHAYAVVLLKFLDGDEAANRAKIRAETTLEYVRKQEARDTKEVCLELCRSLKYFLRSAEAEIQLTR